MDENQGQFIYPQKASPATQEAQTFPLDQNNDPHSLDRDVLPENIREDVLHTMDTGTSPAITEDQASTSDSNDLFTYGKSPVPDNERFYVGMDAVLGEMKNIRESFDIKLKYDNDKVRLIDVLHKELQEAREGLHLKILRPLLMSLIDMHSDLDRLIDDLQTKGTNEQQAVTVQELLAFQEENLRSFQDSIDDLLSRYSVKSFQTEEDSFVPGLQRAMKVTPTTEQEQNKKISRRVRKGFRYDEKILKPELVEIYKFVESTDQ